MAFRLDIGTLRPARRRADGSVVVDAFITRAGIFTYMNPDGTLRRELRDPAEVFDAASMRSFDMLTVTNTHPFQMVTAENARQYMVGASSKVERDDDHLRTELMVADAPTVKEMDDGSKAQVSCGYTCDYDPTPGVHPVWGRYDGRQKNIRGNHIALVSHARAGETARVRMDDAMRQDYSVMATTDAVLTSVVDGHQHSFDPKSVRDGVGYTSYSMSDGATSSHAHDVVRNSDGSFTVSVNDGHTHTLEGLTVEVTDSRHATPMNAPRPRAKEIGMSTAAEIKTRLDAATAELAKESQLRATLAATLKEVEAKLSTETARADAAEGALQVAREKLEEMKGSQITQEKFDAEVAKVADLTTKLAAEKARADAAEDPKVRAAEAEERARVVGIVHQVMGEGYKCDGISNRDLRIEVIKKLGKAPDPKESDAAIIARFDERVSSFDASEAAIARVRAAASVNGQQTRVDTVDDVKRRAEEKRRNSWQATETK